MRGIVLIPLKNLVPEAGLEPARSLERGILRHMGQKLTLPKTNKNRAFSAKNRLKMPQNQTFPFVTKSLKSATSQNFPNFFTKILSLTLSIAVFSFNRSNPNLL